MVDSLKNSALPLGDILKFLKNFWGESNIQVAVIASLAFQVLLVFCAPLRKRSKKSRTLVILWLVYLLSHYVATFAIGLINNYGSASQSNQENSVMALWAPFLLLHLGGPDTITAFAIEDNDLWLRYLLTLIVQVLSVLFVFYRFQIHYNDAFLIPTLLTFAAGIIKYGENIRSLNLASLVSMRKSMRENADYAKTRAVLDEEEEIGHAQETDKHGRDVKIIKKGYELYKKYKAVIVDHVFSFTAREESKIFFSRLPCYKEAFAVIEVELNFMYDAMFTKMIAVQGNIPGYVFRIGCAALIISTLLIFIVHPKHNVVYRDIQVTYCLVGCAVVLDFIALAKHIFCDWTIALLLNNEKFSIKARTRGAKVVNMVRRWITNEMRWSEEIQQYSLIKHSLKSEWKWTRQVFGFFGLTERMEASKNTKTEGVGEALKEMIFNEIKKKAEHADTDEKAGEIYLYRGESVLEECQLCREQIRPKIVGAQYDNVVLMWHIATEICYFTAEKEERDPNPEICRQVSEYLAYLLMMEGKITSAVPGNVGMRFRDICWQEVRDTHIHLKQFIKMKRIDAETSLDQMTEWERKKKRKEEIERKRAELKRVKSFYRYPEHQINSVWKEMKKLFPQNVNLDNAEKRLELTEWERKQKKKEFEARKEVCQTLVEEQTKRKSEGHYEPPRKSLLIEAVVLARRLKELIGGGGDDDLENPTAAAHHHSDESQKKHVWEMMAKVWVEMLCYGACHCRGDVQYLTKGGELLTFVRLLMAHFGLGKQFKKEEEDEETVVQHQDFEL